MDLLARFRPGQGGLRSWLCSVLILVGWLGLANGIVAAQETTSLLRAEHGAPIKLIVREPTAIYDTPSTVGKSQPANLFDFFYAYEPPPIPGNPTKGKTRDGFYYIGQVAPRGEPVGWISAAHVVEWPHRQALGFMPAPGRKRALFFNNLNDLVKVYESGDEPRARALAISEEPPAPSSKPGEAGRRPLLPILEEKEVVIHGDKTKTFRVAYLSNAPKPAPLDITLDVAFVIDATGSMQDWIDKTLSAVSTLALELARLPEMKNKVRFGLVCFRDSPADYLPGQYVPDDNYVVRKYCDLDQGANHSVFLDQLKIVRAEGGGQSPERVLDGLDLAIRQLAWSPKAYKHVILIGNASTHIDPAKSGGLQIAQILKAAQPVEAPTDPAKPITIHAIRVPTVDESDGLVCRDQFKTLAKGLRYPGVYQEQDKLDQFSQALLTLIRGRIQVIGQLAQGEALEGVIESAKTDRLIGPLLPMLEAGRHRTGLVTGYVAETDLDGRNQVEPYLLVQQNQLSTFSAFLSLFVKFISVAGEPGSRDVNVLVRSLKTQLTLLNLGESMDLNTPTSKMLEWIFDAPIRGKIFDITPQVLASMTAEKFEIWQTEIREIRVRLEHFLEDKSRWVHLGRETKPERMHTFIRMVDLP